MRRSPILRWPTRKYIEIHGLCAVSCSWQHHFDEFGMYSFRVHELIDLVIPSGLLTCGLVMLAASVKRRSLNISIACFAAMFVSTAAVFFAHHLRIITTYQCVIVNIALVFATSIGMLAVVLRIPSESDSLAAAVSCHGNDQVKKIFQEVQEAKGD